MATETDILQRLGVLAARVADVPKAMDTLDIEQVAQAMRNVDRAVEGAWEAIEYFEGWA
jgi:hypothetical protein